jgi:hypothetical protein
LLLDGTDAATTGAPGPWPRLPPCILYLDSLASEERRRLAVQSVARGLMLAHQAEEKAGDAPVPAPELTAERVGKALEAHQELGPKVASPQQTDCSSCGPCVLHSTRRFVEDIVLKAPGSETAQGAAPSPVEVTRVIRSDWFTICDANGERATLKSDIATLMARELSVSERQAAAPEELDDCLINEIATLRT